jgi:hypothetical protein
MLDHMPVPYWGVTKTHASWQVDQPLVSSRRRFQYLRAAASCYYHLKIWVLSGRNALMIGSTLAGGNVSSGIVGV